MWNIYRRKLREVLLRTFTTITGMKVSETPMGGPSNSQLFSLPSSAQFSSAGWDSFISHLSNHPNPDRKSKKKVLKQARLHLSQGCPIWIGSLPPPSRGCYPLSPPPSEIFWLCWWHCPKQDGLSQGSSSSLKFETLEKFQSLYGSLCWWQSPKQDWLSQGRLCPLEIAVTFLQLSPF